MESIELIRRNLESSRDLVLANVEDMRAHATVFPTPRGGGHTLWVRGHLAYIEGLVVHTFLHGGENPLAHWEPIFDGADVSADAADFPPFDEVLAACRDARGGDARAARLADGGRSGPAEREGARGLRRHVRHVPPRSPVRRQPLVHAPRPARGRAARGRGRAHGDVAHGTRAMARCTSRRTAHSPRTSSRCGALPRARQDRRLIAPPAKGVDGKPFEFEYVKL